MCTTVFFYKIDDLNVTADLKANKKLNSRGEPLIATQAYFVLFFVIFKQL